MQERLQLEPARLPINGKHSSGKTTGGDQARLDIRARGFCRQEQSAFFDVRVVNTRSPITIESISKQNSRKHENKRQVQRKSKECRAWYIYDLLVFSINSGMAPE